MARKTEQRLIGEHTIEVTTLGTQQAVKALALLQRAVGPALGSLLGDAKGADMDKAVDMALVGRLLSTPIDDDAVWKLSEALAAGSVLLEQGGGPLLPRLSKVFEGDLAGMFEWLMFAVEVNFADFFKRALGGLKAGAGARETSGQGSPSLSTSTGSPGAS